MKILKPAGETVLSAELIAKIAEGTVAAPSKAAESSEQQASASSDNDPHLVPSARKAFNASGLDSAANIQGTGKKGRITSDDVKKLQQLQVVLDNQLQLHSKVLDLKNELR